MDHFVIEINRANTRQTSVQADIDAITKIIDSVGGRLIDSNFNENQHVLSLIIEAASEFIVVGLLESNAFEIEQIRHIFLLQALEDEDENDCVEVASYAGFFGMKELHNTLAIEVYP